MRLIEIDSREKPKAIASIIKYFEHNDIKYVTNKLLFGDYRDYNKPGIVIDRKHNIAELAANCTSEHERFRRELERARDAGATLYILVEQNRYTSMKQKIKVEQISDLLRWESKYTIVTGEKVFRVLVGWMREFPLKVVFCDKRNTGRMIVQIIYGEGDNNA